MCAEANHGSNYTITRQQAMRKSYRRALRTEIVEGAVADEEALSALRINLPKILAYKKKKATGLDDPVKEYADWTHFLLAEYGPRERCLSLGSGIGRVEKYLVDIGFTNRMEAYELCADANTSIRLKDSKIETLASDLNFTDLKPNSYDFILCHGVLHHLINLEHVLYMINLALKKDGIFLVYEYVGENRWQFTEQRLDFLRHMFPGFVFKPPMPYHIDGFESIRSAELLGLIQAQFGSTCKRTICYGGVYFPFLICTTPEADEQIDRVIELDEMVTKEETLPPCYHIGLYGKSDSPPIPAKRWSNEELDSRLITSSPLSTRLKRTLRDTPVGPQLRRLKKLLHGINR